MESNSGTAGEAPIWFINRSVVVVRPRESFVTWANDVDAEGPRLTLEEARLEPNAFLMPEFEMEGESRQWLEENCSLIFEIELDSWYRDPSVWPQDRSWKVFKEWFDVEFIGIAWDLVDEPLSSEPPDLAEEDL